MTEQRRRLRLSLRVAFHPSLASQNPTLYYVQGAAPTHEPYDFLTSLYHMLDALSEETIAFTIKLLPNPGKTPCP